MHAASDIVVVAAVGVVVVAAVGMGAVGMDVVAHVVVVAAAAVHGGMVVDNMVGMKRRRVIDAGVSARVAVWGLRTQKHYAHHSDYCCHCQ